MSKRQRLLALARQGHPNVVARLLDHKLRARGWRARVARKDRELLVLVEGSTAPDVEEVAGIIEAIAAKLDSEYLDRLKVCGRARQSSVPAWMRVFAVCAPPPDEFGAWLQSVQGDSSLAARAAPSGAATGKRFLRFRCGEESALLPVDYIQEVLSVRPAALLPVPHAHPCALGLYNWRGEMLWAIDLDRLLGFAPLYQAVAADDEVGIIVARTDGRTLGLTVRAVETIEQHDWQKLQPPGGLFSAELLAYVEGYLTAANSIILSAPAIVRAPVWTQRDHLDLGSVA